MTFPGNRFFMDVGDNSFGVRVDEELFVNTGVVISEDDEKPCFFPCHFLDLFDGSKDGVFDEEFHGQILWDMERQEVSPEKNSIRCFLLNKGKERVISFKFPMKV